jgi:dienelactone hydrolase
LTRHNDPAKLMRLLSAVTFLTPFAVAFAVDAAPLPSPEQVDIPLGSGILHAQLYKPDGDGPFPTVIALHACGGLAGNSEPVQPRYRDWAEQLLKAGNAVLLPDSYGSRELGPQCRVNERRVLARRERVVDVMASRQWLVQQPWIARDRISLMGWANGASAVLWAVRPQLSSRGVDPDFRSAIAFYPDCRISSGLRTTSVRRPPAVRWSTARAGAARWRGSWFIPAPITISTAPIFPFTRSAEPEMPPYPKRGTSAPTRKPAPIRNSASRSGSQGSRSFPYLPAKSGER